ncbi:NAD(P)H-dependent flavin oxidoreductase [Nocardia sp. NPDC056611]|uniref:NAD(P)H-dependent flavin oxidoreductase n=1 Tax=Nocardia sp. NPDC056611 TaxID=3345877 RepID=UPI00366D31B8
MTEDAGLRTDWSDAMGLRVPIVNAPMGGVAGGRLAVAVAAAGGLGMIGMGSAGSVEALERELAAAALERELPALERELMGNAAAPAPGPIGIGLVDWVAAARPGLLALALAAKPALLSVSFGTDLSWAARAHAAGIRTATQVYTLEDARRARDAGIDVLVARGLEGGGHGAPELATLPLLEAVLDAVPGPVLAAGGIGSARGVAAMLAAGAAGVWLGTAVAAAEESLLAPGGRRALLAAQGTDTIVTRVFDIGMELPWPQRFPARVLRNDFTARWHDRIDELSAAATSEPEPAATARADRAAAARAQLAAANAADDPRIAPVDAGQGVGLVTAVRPVAEILGELCSGVARA